MTARKKQYIGGGVIWGILVGSIIYIFSSGCGASFPNSKPQMIFQNCQIVNTTADGALNLKCMQPTTSDDNQDAKDSSALFSIPGKDSESGSDNE